MATEGIFVCGTAHSPKLMHETIAQAYGGGFPGHDLPVPRTIDPLGRDRPGGYRIMRSLPDLCAVLSLRCSEINADGVSEIDEALCHGCGICAAECPAKAIELTGTRTISSCARSTPCWRRVL